MSEQIESVRRADTARSMPILRESLKNLTRSMKDGKKYVHGKTSTAVSNVRFSYAAMDSTGNRTLPDWLRQAASLSCEEGGSTAPRYMAKSAVRL
ncbi:MAG TPA: hypothetical protein VNZ65_07790 [Collimonas sp.]|nr:hypothetical protein [Collimonas sp.]